MIKRGDERLEGFGVLLEKLNSTPLGELEKRTRYRDLKFEFVVLQIREATVANPTTYVVEVRISGKFHAIVKGEIISRYEEKRFQGIGFTTKEAKYNAATAALVNLGSAMPGKKKKY